MRVPKLYPRRLNNRLPPAKQRHLDVLQLAVRSLLKRLREPPKQVFVPLVRLFAPVVRVLPNANPLPMRRKRRPLFLVGLP